MEVVIVKKKKKKTAIGWQEWCGLPELGLPAVKAKIDTGARTSALHAYDMEFFKQNGMDYVSFKIQPLKNRKLVRICEAPLVDERMVISSNGEREKRPVIITVLDFGVKKIQAEITLTSRHKMNFRMLLGLTALKKARFVIEPSKTFLLGDKDRPQELY